MKLSVRLIVPVLVLALLAVCTTVHALELPVFAKYKILHFRYVYVSPGGSIPISGWLWPGSCDIYGPLDLSSGSIVHVDLSWIPGMATLMIGLYETTTNDYVYEIVTGGHANITFTAWVTGRYYLFICDESPYIVYYSGMLRIS